VAAAEEEFDEYELVAGVATSAAFWERIRRDGLFSNLKRGLCFPEASIAVSI
jgi:hypothetical protein